MVYATNLQFLLYEELSILASGHDHFQQGWNSPILRAADARMKHLAINSHAARSGCANSTSAGCGMFGP
jgi:hypothetical protein